MARSKLAALRSYWSFINRHFISTLCSVHRPSHRVYVKYKDVYADEAALPLKKSRARLGTEPNRRR